MQYTLGQLEAILDAISENHKESNKDTKAMEGMDAINFLMNKKGSL